MSSSPLPWSKDDNGESISESLYSLQAEQSLLGALIKDPVKWDEIIEHIQLEDFYFKQHRQIISAMAKLISANQPVDVVTVNDCLHDAGQLEQIGGAVYLLDLFRHTPTAGNAFHYAQIVHSRAIRRKLVQAAEKIITTSEHPEGKDLHEIIEIAEQQIFAISQDNRRVQGPQLVSGMLGQLLDRLQELKDMEGHITGMASGFQDLDHLTSGLQDGDLVVVAGRPSSGKTAFAMNLVENCIFNARKPALVFSLEMPSEALLMRLISSLSAIEQKKLRAGHLADEDWNRITSSIGMLEQVKLLIDDTPSISPSEIRSRARAVVREHGQLGLIVLDYLQLMSVPRFRENRTAEISEISRGLKLLAKELSTPIIALSQLNRELEHRQNKRPMMSDLRESGAIEQDADVILFIYRDEIYYPDTEAKGIAEIIIAKQRNGPIGTVKLAFRGKFCRFDDLAADISKPVY